MVGGLRFRGWRRKDGAVRDFLVDSKLPPRRALNLGKKRERERERRGERIDWDSIFEASCQAFVARWGPVINHLRGRGVEWTRRASGPRRVTRRLTVRTTHCNHRATQRPRHNDSLSSDTHTHTHTHAQKKRRSTHTLRERDRQTE